LGINDSWNTLRQTMATQRRVTVTLQRRDGRTVHVRKATRPKPRHQTLGTILKLEPNPGRTHRVLVCGNDTGRLDERRGNTIVVPYAPRRHSKLLISLGLLRADDKLGLGNTLNTSAPAIPLRSWTGNSS
jgi:hypothetical protein